MYVKSLDLQNYRNYESLSLVLDPGTNIFYGNNAQGKTNILEAVYLAGTSKSHRSSRDRDIIRMGSDESHIRMLLDRHENEYRIDIHLKRSKPKGIAINGEMVKRAAELFGIASLVLFSPEDLGIIKSGPSARRRFLDLVLCGIDRVYMADLTRYGKILTSRNALLHAAAFDRNRLEELDIWDLQLIETGSRIIRRRSAFVEDFSRKAAAEHAHLTDGGENLEILYEKNTSEEDFRDKILRIRETDLRMRTTGAGPHRDDLCIREGGMDLRVYGSQGQQRTAALSMKLAEISVMKEEKKENPVLLLDDVLSELDEKRQRALLSGIRNTQTLITCTGLDEYVRREFQADKIFHVVNGTVEEG